MSAITQANEFIKNQKWLSTAFKHKFIKLIGMVAKEQYALGKQEAKRTMMNRTLRIECNKRGWTLLNPTPDSITIKQNPDNIVPVADMEAVLSLYFDTVKVHSGNVNNEITFSIS